MIGGLSSLPRLPLALWGALGGLLLWPIASSFHDRAVKRLDKAAYARGVSDERQRSALATEKLRQIHSRQQEALSDAIRDQEEARRRRRDELAHHLSLRGPGAVGTGHCPRAPAQPSPGRPDPAAGGLDARLAELPEGERRDSGAEPFAILPWGELVRRARTCDDNRAEVTAWRQWWAGQAALPSDFPALP